MALLVHRDRLAAHGLFRDHLERLQHNRLGFRAAMIGSLATELEILRNLSAGRHRHP